LIVIQNDGSTVAAEGFKAPIGEAVRMKEYPNASFTAVTAPNAYTLYTQAWFDVSKEPRVVSVPNMKGRYFLLPMRHSSVNPCGSSLGIGPIRFPGYLDRQEMVTRTAPNRIDLSENDRWAEPLEANFARTLSQNLSSLLQTERLMFYP
jgi:hypothetical protein